MFSHDASLFRNPAGGRIIQIFRTRSSFTIAGSLLLGVSLAAGAPVFAQQSTAAVRDQVEPEVFNLNLAEVQVTQPLRVWKEGDAVLVVEDLKESAGQTMEVPKSVTIASSAEGAALAPVAGVNFDGINATGVLPPDTVGDVGPNHYIQMVNSAFSIFDKAGNQLVGPLNINVLWSGFGGPCEAQNRGDPVVRYDQLADRWLISQFALPGGPQGFHECVAISRTPDPVAGGWFLYDFPTIDTATNNPIFPDYPKIAVWPDAYYMGTQRGFPNSGLDVWAMERDEMLVGGPARIIQFAVPAPSLFLMPSDLDGPPPPKGTPNFFARQVDGDRFGGQDRLEIFAFSVDWANPANSTFTNIANLNTQPFDSMLCSGGLLGPCVPQPGTTRRLETLTVWPMWRLQYRNFGNYEAMVVNHTVDANGNDLAGVRWYEVRRSTGGAWSIFQQGTHSSDDLHRWMGSVAMDRDGNIAVGYSVSGVNEFPGIRVGSRLTSDPLGTLPQPELTIVSGGGAQTHSSSRYGNYSSMDVDPKDDCTFWYTTEYYASTSTAGWRTRIASFRLPECGQGGDEGDKPAYEYVAKLICGIQNDPRDMRLVRGFYGTAVNIHNPGHAPATLFKKLALTFPPKEQAPGKVIPIAKDTLQYDQALATDCMDIRERLFPRGLPTPYIKGFVVVQSDNPLDVTAVYTSATLDKRGEVESVSSIDVEQIRERRSKAESGCPDLVIKDIGRPSVSCPGGGGTCTTTVDITVGNSGTANSGPFVLQGIFDPGQSMNASANVGGLQAGGSSTQTLTTGADGNCFDPDCTITAIADPSNRVRECNESNNSAKETTLG